MRGMNIDNSILIFEKLKFDQKSDEVTSDENRFQF